MSSEAYKKFKPLHDVCEFLDALHIYADQARHNATRYVEATHNCAHARPDLRQCLIYDSPDKNARLIGVEYMIPKHVYDTLDDDEQKLWHSHNFEVKSGMLILPKPEKFNPEEWEKAETEALKEIVGLYGKSWHFWQIDKSHNLPLGYPTLMGSLTEHTQIDLDTALKARNEKFGVHHGKKAKQREVVEKHLVHPLADSLWKEGRK